MNVYLSYEPNTRCILYILQDYEYETSIASSVTFADFETGFPNSWENRLGFYFTVIVWLTSILIQSTNICSIILISGI